MCIFNERERDERKHTRAQFAREFIKRIGKTHEGKNGNGEKEQCRTSHNANVTSAG